MTVEKLERVMWRIRARFPNQDTILIKDVENAIMHEIGTDPRTWKLNFRSLQRLGWIKRTHRSVCKLTGNDLTGD